MSIRFENLSKSFGNKPVLDDVSFAANAGEILFILGKSGVGKSVTLKHIIGVLQPDSGKVWVDGIEVSQLIGDDYESELQKIRRKCGMVFQHPALLDSITNFENIAFGLRNRGMLEGEIKRVVQEKLALVHLGEEILPLYPFEVSHGVQKRIAIARTLAPEPDYLLFDEPTTSLDPFNTHAINDLIYELSRKLNVTSIVVSHDMAGALSIADTILFLDQGKMILKGTPKEVVQSQIPLVKAFFAETLALLPANGDAR